MDTLQQITQPALNLTGVDLFLLLLNAVLSFLSKFAVDFGVKNTNIPNYWIAAGGLVIICLLSAGMAFLFHLNVVWAVATAAIGYMGGSLTQTARKPNT